MVCGAALATYMALSLPGAGAVGRGGSPLSLGLRAGADDLARDGPGARADRGPLEIRLAAAAVNETAPSAESKA